MNFDQHAPPTDDEVQLILTSIEQQIATWKGNPDYARRLRVTHNLVLSADKMRRGLAAIRAAANAGRLERDRIAWLDENLQIADYCTLLIGDDMPSVKPRRRRLPPRAILKRKANV